MNKTVFIYALREVGTDEYRYVGKSNKPKKRLYHHIRNSVKLKTYKHKWIQSVLKKGSNIEFVILEEVDVAKWGEREIFWIDKLKNEGYRLSNATEGGDCGPVMKGDFLPFNEAKSIVQKLNIKNRNEWKEYCNSIKPNNIPKRPDEVYDEWVGLGDWLGTGRVANHKKEFLSYYDAKKIIHKLKINTNKEWRLFCKNNKSDNIPSNPDQYYLNKGWISWSDFLNNSNIQNQKIKFIDFESAKNEIRKFNIKSVKDWRLFKNSNKKPNLIPSSPESVYKSEWRGFPDFLGY